MIKHLAVLEHLTIQQPAFAAMVEYVHEMITQHVVVAQLTIDVLTSVAIEE